MALGPAEVAHGPMFIGLMFNILLYGIMITQCYLYYATSKNDRLWIKLFVLLLFIADTVNTVFDLIYVYDSVIIHFDDAPFLATANWVFATDPAMTAIIATLVQSFFAWRVKTLTSNNVAVICIMTCAFTGILSGIGTAIAIRYVPHFAEFLKFKVVVIFWLTANAVGDTIITTVLVWHLMRRKTGIAATDDIVNRIIKVTVETGLVTSICAVIDLVTFLVIPTGIHLIFNFPLSKLYTNSLMSSLNSRAIWNSRFEAPQGISVVKSSRTSQSHTKFSLPRSTKKTESTARSEVFVHVESHEMRDWDDGKTGVDMGPIDDVQVNVVGFDSHAPDVEAQEMGWKTEKRGEGLCE